MPSRARDQIRRECALAARKCAQALKTHTLPEITLGFLRRENADLKFLFLTENVLKACKYLQSDFNIFCENLNLQIGNVLSYQLIMVLPHSNVYL